MNQPILDEKLGPLPVAIVEEPEKVQAADFGNFTTITLTGTENGLGPILSHDIYRRRAVIAVHDPVVGGATTGSVTTPGAAASIASFVLAPGVYRLDWMVGLEGTVSATDVNNFQLSVIGGTNYTSENPGAVGNYTQNPVYVNLGPGNTTIRVRSIGAGTVGAIYNAQLTATPIGQVGYCLIGSLRQVQNGQGGKLRPGDSFTLENMREYYVSGDGSTPIELVILNERYDPSGENIKQSEQDHI